MAAGGKDKRVYDLRASGGGRTRVIALSADSTLLDAHLALLGAFDWRGDYGREERAYRVEFSRTGQLYSGGRGSRTRLRRLLSVGDRFRCSADDPQIELDCEVLREYEVSNRRHYPKVLEADGGEHEARAATWQAQSAARRELRDAGPNELEPREPLTPEYLRGMFAAVVSGPMVMPSAWLFEAMRTPLDTLEHVQRETDAIMSDYNTVARQMLEAPDRFIEETRRMLSGNESGGALESWVRGYVHGMALAGDEWRKHFSDEELRKFFTPIGMVIEMYSTPHKRAWRSDAELRENLAHACPIAAVQIWEFWRRRVG